MTKLAKKTWTCQVGHGCKKASDVTEAKDEQDNKGVVEKYRKFSSVVSRDDVGVARKPTPPPQEMQKCVDESSMRLKEEVTPKETSKEKKEEEKEKEQEREKEEETQDIDEDLEALKKRLVRFYEVYKPNQIPRVPDIAKKYAHRTNELFQALEVRNLFSHFFFFFYQSNSHTRIYIYTEKIRSRTH
jgi:hypothetical protein